MTVARSTQHVVEVLASYIPEARSTQHVVEVLATYIPEGRSTQYVIEVLYNLPIILGATVIDTSIVVDAKASVDYQATLIIDVSITISAKVETDIEGKAFFNTILSLGAKAEVTYEAKASISGSVTVAAKGTVKSSSAIITTSLIIDAVASVDYETKASINVSININAKGRLQEKPGNTLLLTQTVSVTVVLNLSINSVLVFTQSATVNKSLNLSTSSLLIFNQLATFKRVLLTRTTISPLSLTQTVDYAFPVESILNLVQEAIHTPNPVTIASNTLSLSQQVSVNFATILLASNQLILTQVVDPDFIFNRSLTSNLNFEQSQIIGQRIFDFVVLQAPFNKTETETLLPTPLFQDIQNRLHIVNTRKSIDNIKYTYVKKSGTQRLAYTFRLTREKSLELKAFIDAHIDDEWRMQNWKGEIWKVFLSNNPIDFIATRRGFPCGDEVDVSLEFEGVKLSG